MAIDSLTPEQALRKEIADLKAERRLLQEALENEKHATAVALANTREAEERSARRRDACAAMVDAKARELRALAESNRAARYLRRARAIDLRACELEVLASNIRAEVR